MRTTEDRNTEHLNLPKGSRGRRGRKNSAGDEEVLKAQPIKDALSELMIAYKSHEAAKVAYNELRKKVAERANCNAADLGRLLRASATGKFEDTKRHIEQQSELFELIGEVPGVSEQ